MTKNSHKPAILRPLHRLVIWFWTRRTSDLLQAAFMAALAMGAGLKGLIITQTVGTASAFWLLYTARPDNAKVSEQPRKP